MAKKPTLSTIASGYASNTTLNSNFEALRNAFDNTLSLDGSTPNAMGADLDLNGNNIIGATGLTVNGTDYLADVTAAKAAALVAQAAAELAETNAETSETNASSSQTASASSATAASSSATAAQTAETNAELAETGAAASAATATTKANSATAKASEASASATNAATSESNAATSATSSASSATASETAKTASEAAKDATLAALDSFDDRYLGQKAANPALDNDGNALVAGALYFNTTDDTMKVYDGSAWLAAYASLSGALIATSNLSDVTDVAASRTNLGLGTAATTASSAYATAAQGTLAASATQPADLGTAAATAATDYATAAQGVKADSALQPTGNGSGLTSLTSANLVGALPALDGSSLTSLTSANLTGALPAIDGSSLTGINTEPHKPAVPTGATPSLDLGTYNYFRQTLTADTTLTFASVPTDARWSYTFNTTLSSAYDLTSATTAVQNSFTVNPQDSLPSGLFFKPDGTKMYMSGDTGNDINEYDLSTAWDISTASFLQLFSVAGQETFPYEVFFSPDGIYMYTCGESSDSVHQYTLGTAWDISSAVFTRSLSVTTRESVP